VVFVTGGASAPTRAFLERVPNDRLEKPFESAALFELLAKKMAGR